MYYLVIYFHFVIIRNKLYKYPPLPLTEKYFECKETIGTILINNFGIASSNATVFTAPAIVVVFYFIYYMMQRMGKPIPEERYSDEDKDKVLKEIAYHILKLNDVTSSTKLETLSKICKELKEEANSRVASNEATTNTLHSKDIELKGV